MSSIKNKYFHRDLSWLRFNHRVLQEAKDHRNPLYERIKFLAIFSSNLDEFFKVRVSDIRKIKNLDKKLRKKLITKPNKLLKKIKKEVAQQQQEFGIIFRESILPALIENQIHLINRFQFTKHQQNFITEYYQEKLANKVTVIHTKAKKDDLFLNNEELYLVGIDKKGSLQSVLIPPDSKRFVVLPEEEGSFAITFIDDILKFVLKEKYGIDFYAIKISRDAELYIDNEYSGNLLDKIKDSLENRETGQVTRLLIDKHASENLVELLQKILDVNDTDIIQGGMYHNFKDFFTFPNPSHQNLHLKPLLPLPHKELKQQTDLFQTIKEKDRLLYFPYQSFDHVLDLVQQAAIDPTVTKIKITMYRIAAQSGIAELLLAALKNGKEVFAFIETKARFDEENNIKWGAKLSDNGAVVKYSYPGIKVHSKILSIEREEEGKLIHYAYISTGNFNEKTAKIYTDYGLMTANPKITEELEQVFLVLEGKIIVPRTKHLLVSPFSTRTTFEDLVRNEIKNAKAQKPAGITLKINSLQDKKMIKLLYEANNAGVPIQLLIRGICCLIPGIEGLSEHIKVYSIVDRFLEHGRVYIFQNNGQEKMFMGSADWMTRNLDHRIEVITPIYDPDVAKLIKGTLSLQFKDTVKRRVIDAEQSNDYYSEDASAPEQIQSQVAIYEQLAK
ncbi:polyphosphate kinase 1 [Aquimarina sp. ERC-38]|uniref:polyphosphate kinase 1 n=1 Tax=Aquimarina sp. ERC-38 TaxID=2949996 RepID=UPI00224562CA|nr:polyphosphate kinase 1 [Aquimarina sp. ERC-38]UZO82466.1 polyphosphate kinase 1 [Aquimarina sp. ERC-38]